MYGRQILEILKNGLSAFRSNATCSSDINLTGTSESSTTREISERVDAVNNGVKSSAATAV